MSVANRSHKDLLNDPTVKYESMDATSKWYDKKKQDSPTATNFQDRMRNIRKSIVKPGVHSASLMFACGLPYTGTGDTGRCERCRLEISNWTSDMNPFTIHSKERPDCPFVQFMKQSSSVSTSSTTTVTDTSISIKQENPSKRQKLEIHELQATSNILIEMNLIKQVRKRTFSHWPHRTIPSTAQMIEAGFFNCNVGDRIICIYCNLICQQWTPHTDDPCEVHKTLSPDCIYVKAKLIRPAASSILIVNESSTGANANILTTNNHDPLRSNEIVFTAACNPAYTEIPKRHASFATWPIENLPSVDDLVRAGFFYTGTKTIVTCFYCNGSLQNWGSNDNPMIEHARWFPHCAYAKQLCGDELYRKIQESKRAQQERARANEAKEKAVPGAAVSTNTTSTSRQLVIPDESTLSRLVAARLDLPISQRLLDQNFKLSIIKRCWEDQLRLKQDDFQTDCDLYIACVILQKQIEHIDGKKENIVIPSIKMKQIRERIERALNPPVDVEMTTSMTSDSTSSQSSTESTSKPPPIIIDQGDIKIEKPIITPAKDSDQSANSSPANPCVLCLTEEKRLACIPCGHLATCVPCGHSLRSCPICRREIEAFVRVYI